MFATSAHSLFADPVREVTDTSESNHDRSSIAAGCGVRRCNSRRTSLVAAFGNVAG
jgi:hypothetical protein